MVKQEFCEHCEQRHKCQQVYQQLGRAKSPSVVFKVIIAFLLPIIIFIATLMVFEAVLAKVINVEGLRTAVSFLLGLSTTFVAILLIKVVERQFIRSE